jgi:hypothetical protein
MSVLQKLFSHSPPEAPAPQATSFVADSNDIAPAQAEPPDDMIDYVDDADPTLHDPGEPPHWAPECGTPAYSTRHHTGA